LRISVSLPETRRRSVEILGRRDMAEFESSGKRVGAVFRCRSLERWFEIFTDAKGLADGRSQRCSPPRASPASGAQPQRAVKRQLFVPGRSAPPSGTDRRSDGGAHASADIRAIA
jgi:hypothetical protein